MGRKRTVTKLESEIHDQKQELRVVFDWMLTQDINLSPFLKASCAYFVGCGSSYYLAISAAKYFTRQLGKFAKAVPGGEVALSFSENVSKQSDSSIAVLISRSGESTETVLAAKKFKENGIYTFFVTLNPASELHNLCDDGIVLPVEETSIVMTKSFTSMLLSLFVITDLAAKTDLRPYKLIFDRIDYFFTDPSFLDPKGFNHLVFLGKGVYEGVARESALKLEEMSLTLAEAYPTFEYRHGPKSLVTDRTLMVIFSSDDKEEQDFVREMKGYGATVVERKVLDTTGRDAFAQVIFSQLMGLHFAKVKGVNPERPRNLTRVVELDA